MAVLEDHSWLSSDHNRTAVKTAEPKVLGRRKARQCIKNAQRTAMIKACEAGEKIESAAERFGVTTGYPGILARGARISLRRLQGRRRT